METENKEEQTVNESEKVEQPKKPADRGELIAKAEAAAERLERANEKMEALVARQEALAVDKLLGGEAKAGDPAKPKEESDLEYAQRVMRNEL